MSPYAAPAQPGAAPVDNQNGTLSLNGTLFACPFAPGASGATRRIRFLSGNSPALSFSMPTTSVARLPSNTPTSVIGDMIPQAVSDVLELPPPELHRLRAVVLNDDLVEQPAAFVLAIVNAPAHCDGLAPAGLETDNLGRHQVGIVLSGRQNIEAAALLLLDVKRLVKLRGHGPLLSALPKRR